MVPSEGDPRAAFEQRLAREILSAERFRATLLAVLPTVTMLAFLAVSSAYPDVVTALLHGKFDRAPVGLFLCAVAGFEFHVLYATERMLRNGQRPSAARNYGYAFVETSLPTLVIVYYATILGPVQAVDGKRCQRVDDLRRDRQRRQQPQGQPAQEAAQGDAAQAGRLAHADEAVAQPAAPRHAAAGLQQVA